jgi:hypothetical protein
VNLSKDWNQPAIHIRDFFETLKIIGQNIKIPLQERQILKTGSCNALNTNRLTVDALFLRLPAA